MLTLKKLQIYVLSVNKMCHQQGLIAVTCQETCYSKCFRDLVYLCGILEAAETTSFAVWIVKKLILRFCSKIFSKFGEKIVRC
jgi:hypothetical protein